MKYFDYILEVPSIPSKKFVSTNNNLCPWTPANCAIVMEYNLSYLKT